MHFNQLGCKSVVTIGTLQDHQRICEYEPNSSIPNLDSPKSQRALIKSNFQQKNSPSVIDLTNETVKAESPAKDPKKRTLPSWMTEPSKNTSHLHSFHQ